MMLGLQRNTVRLCEHEDAWEKDGAEAVCLLKQIFGDIAVDIQHVGSTSVLSIKAKPIIDIAVGVRDFDSVFPLLASLEEKGFYYRPDCGIHNQLLLACGSLYDGTGDLQTHFIHIVIYGGKEWTDYINFRNYLNKTPSAAKEYEALKVSLAEALPFDKGREQYLKGKQNFIIYTLRKALADSYLGKTVTVKIDRPAGYVHKKENYELVYPINYGYIPGVIGGDGEELDVYVLGQSEPLCEFTGKIIAVIHRENDVEDKLVAAPDGTEYSQEEIESAVYFQERYYITHTETFKQEEINYDN